MLSFLQKPPHLLPFTFEPIHATFPKFANCNHPHGFGLCPQSPTPLPSRRLVILAWTQFQRQCQCKPLPDDWDPEGGEGSNLLWVREDIGGPCTPIVMNGKLYTIQRSEPGTAREGEKVVCLNAATGETIWENRYNVWLSDVPAERVGWSSVVGDPETGYVYALGALLRYFYLHERRNR